MSERETVTQGRAAPPKRRLGGDTNSIGCACAAIKTSFEAPTNDTLLISMVAAESTCEAGRFVTGTCAQTRKSSVPLFLDAVKLSREIEEKLAFVETNESAVVRLSLFDTTGE